LKKTRSVDHENKFSVKSGGYFVTARWHVGGRLPLASLFDGSSIYAQMITFGVGGSAHNPQNILVWSIYPLRALLAI